MGIVHDGMLSDLAAGSNGLAALASTSVIPSLLTNRMSPIV